MNGQTNYVRQESLEENRHTWNKNRAGLLLKNKVIDDSRIAERLKIICRYNEQSSPYSLIQLMDLKVLVEYLEAISLHLTISLPCKLSETNKQTDSQTDRQTDACTHARLHTHTHLHWPGKSCSVQVRGSACGSLHCFIYQFN